ncbi:MAG: enoyl-CoA hydratase/isomerase family protein [Acetobacterales bacterium]
MKQDFETVSVSTRKGVGTLLLNRPESRNALNLRMCLDLLSAIEGLAADPKVKVVLVRGEGPVFCAGADLKERKGKGPDWVAERRRRSFAAYAAMDACEKPMIAVVHGPAVGSGCEIASACDFLLASEKASFRYPEAVWGSVGATQRLPRIVGAAMAKELLFTGRVVGAEEALRLRLANHVFPADTLAREARTMAEQVAAAPPLAVRLAKRSIDLGGDTDFARGVAIERMAIDRALADSEWKRGVTAFSKRKKAGA